MLTHLHTPPPPPPPPPATTTNNKPADAPPSSRHSCKISAVHQQFVCACLLADGSSDILSRFQRSPRICQTQSIKCKASACARMDIGRNQIMKRFSFAIAVVARSNTTQVFNISSKPLQGGEVLVHNTAVRTVSIQKSHNLQNEENSLLATIFVLLILGYVLEYVLE